MAGGGSSILARGRLGSAGKRRDSGVGSPRVPFRGFVAAEERPMMVISDVGGRQTLRVVVRRGAGSAGATSRAGNSGGGLRRWWRAQATGNEPES
jgi:hypothetical protein